MPNEPTVWPVRIQALHFDLAEEAGDALLVGFHKASA
jgi:hypothetical protein